MLKHVSTLSLDTSRRSLRTSGRLSLAWEDVDELDLRCPPASMATLPRPREKETSLPSLSPSSPWSYRVSVSPESEPESDVEAVPNQSEKSGVRAIKVYAQCLRPHLSYKTVVVTPHTTSKQVILGLLSRFRMRHRDPNLFYLTMEVTVDKATSKQTILLEDNARPSEMISCNPWGGCKFILQAKQGGLVKVYDHLVRPDSIYKSLIISGETTVGDTVRILRCCYREGEEGGLHLWEVAEGLERRLGDEERPLVVMASWKEEEDRRLLLRPSSVLERGMARGSVMRQTIRRRQRVMDTQAQMEVCAALSLCTLDSDTASELGSEEGEGRVGEAMSTSSSDSSEWTPTPGYCSIYISGNGTDSFFT